MDIQLKHLSYRGSVEIDCEKKTFRGKILGITDLVTYEADNLTTLHAEFVLAIRDYLETLHDLQYQK